MRPALTGFALLLLLSGCKHIYLVPEKKEPEPRHLQTADWLQFCVDDDGSGGPQCRRVTDPATMLRLAHIHDRAHWKSCDSSPLNPMHDHQIHVYRGDERLWTIYFPASCQIHEYVEDEGWQYAELREADRDWIESLFPRRKVSGGAVQSLSLPGGFPPITDAFPPFE